MKRIRCRITKGGQVTLPAEVRRLLGVALQDEIEFDIDENEVRVIRPRYTTLESIKGSVGPPTRTEDIDKMIKEAFDDWADKHPYG
jgi:AbrB family looped-hinge helix DNA binding protein